MVVRKCKKNEIEKIVEVANKSFQQDREAGFTFKKSKPVIYSNKNRDYSNIHFVIEDKKGQFLGVIGNLIDEIKLSNNSYKFSRIGTVGTLPEHRGRGYMVRLMQAVNNENINKKVVFSVLCGKRNRYKNYGYERSGLTCYYTFDTYQEKYLKNDFEVTCRPYKKEDLNNLYTIYLAKEKFVLRSIEEFEIILNNCNTKLFTLVSRNAIIGYFAIKNSTIMEINVENEKYVESVLNSILSNNKICFNINKYNSKTIQICVNNLNIKLCEELDKFAEYKTCIDELSIKVYDFERFIRLLFDLNREQKSFIKCTEVYKIGDKIYKFKYKKGDLTLIQTKQKFSYAFDGEHSFIRFVLGNDLLFNKISKLFPLKFDINALDNF